MPLMSERAYVVTVALAAAGERATLLGMASLLQRRGTDVVEAELSRPALGRRVFSATFIAEPARAVTVLHSFEGLVDVIDASLYEAFDTRHVDVEPVVHESH